jgi:hypothetical protein
MFIKSYHRYAQLYHQGRPRRPRTTSYTGANRRICGSFLVE